MQQLMYRGALALATSLAGFSRPAIEPDKTCREEILRYPEKGINGKSGPPLLLDGRALPEAVRNLGDDSFRTREDAFLLLKKLGDTAFDLLVNGEVAKDPEIRRRSKQLLDP